MDAEPECEGCTLPGYVEEYRWQPDNLRAWTLWQTLCQCPDHGGVPAALEFVEIEFASRAEAEEIWRRMLRIESIRCRIRNEEFEARLKAGK